MALLSTCTLLNLLEVSVLDVVVGVRLCLLTTLETLTSIGTWLRTCLLTLGIHLL